MTRQSPLLIAAFAAVFNLMTLPPALGQDSAPPEESDKVYDPADLATLRPLVGNRVTVEGAIVGTSGSKSGTVRYLNFSKNYRSAVSLVFFLEGAGAGEYTQDKLQEYVGKKLRANGVLSEHQQALQIKIDDFSQIQVVE